MFVWSNNLIVNFFFLTEAYIFLFSTSVELESENVCLFQILWGSHGDFKNGRIQFGTLVPWWFSKIFLGPKDEFLASKLKIRFKQIFVVIICYLTLNIFNFTIGPLNNWKIFVKPSAFWRHPTTIISFTIILQNFGHFFQTWRYTFLFIHFLISSYF